MNRMVHQLLRILPDSTYLKIQYRYITHRKLNLKNPTRYNEKLQWLKIHDRKQEYTTYVDKCLVKDFVASKIGDKYIIPTLSIWSNANQINFDKLPNQFVLKCNHDSKSVYICKNKREFDIKGTIFKLNKAIKRNHFSYGREWPYKNVKPVIFAEQYMEDESGGLQDYKVLCFNGVAKLVQLHRGRFTQMYTHEIYDRNWILQSYNQKGLKISEHPLDRPVFLQEMLELSEILSKGIPHIRVDWYYVNGQLYFGELTFFDAAGYDEFEPDIYNEIIGDWISLKDV